MKSQFLVHDYVNHTRKQDNTFKLTMQIVGISVAVLALLATFA